MLLTAWRRSRATLPVVVYLALSCLAIPVIAFFVRSKHYYFHPRHTRHALPVLLPALMDVVESCSAPARAPALRFQASMLRQALDDLLATIGEQFVGTPPDRPDLALAAYRRDHLWVP